MIIPQTNAYHLLSNRLSMATIQLPISRLAILEKRDIADSSREGGLSSPDIGIQWDDLLSDYKRMLSIMHLDESAPRDTVAESL